MLYTKHCVAKVHDLI